MTNNEIIKALECCVNEKADCKGCPYESDGCLIENGKNKLLEDTLDLINRQKAEIERLKDDKNRLEKMMDNLCKELDAEKNKNF